MFYLWQYLIFQWNYMVYCWISDKFANHWLYKIKGSLCACGKWFVHWLLQPYTIYLILHWWIQNHFCSALSIPISKTTDMTTNRQWCTYLIGYFTGDWSYWNIPGLLTWKAKISNVVNKQIKIVLKLFIFWFLCTKWYINFLSFTKVCPL